MKIAILGTTSQIAQNLMLFFLHCLLIIVKIK